jgi:hypothetical protein
VSPTPKFFYRLTAATLALVVVLWGAADLGRLPWLGSLLTSASAATLDPPVYHPPAITPALEQDFIHKGFKRDPQSGNYMSPKLTLKTVHEPLAPVLIDGKYVKDARGLPIFLRQSIRDKVEAADGAMFQHKKQHLKIVYGFRANALQYELFQKINGHGKVAPAGMSFHETGMAVDLGNWRDAQGYMINAGFVGGCFGLEEDMVHYSINEITKASDFEEFKRCTFKEIPEDVLKAAKKAGIESEKFVGIITFGHLGTKKTTE